LFCLCVTGEVEALGKNEEAFPTMVDMLLLSKNAPIYKWVCAKLLKSVVGSNVWNRRHHKESLSDVATCSDESFLLLTIENNYERWLQEAEWIRENRDKDDKDPKNFVEAIYTNAGSSKANGRSRRFNGWSREGYLRFNELYSLVVKDREGRTKFEMELRSTFIEDMENYNEDSGSEEEAEEIFPANDMFGVGQPVESYDGNGTQLPKGVL
jgi:hypothetical protein